MSWDYKVFKWVIMIFLCILWSFVKFGSQTSKNIQDVRKLTFKYVLVEPSMFGRVLCVNFGWNLHRRSFTCKCTYLRWKFSGTTFQGSRKRAHKKDQRDVETLPWQCQSTSQNDASSMGRNRWELSLGMSWTHDSHKPNWWRAHNGPSMDQLSIVGSVEAGWCITACALLIKGVNGKFTPRPFLPL